MLRNDNQWEDYLERYEDWPELEDIYLEDADRESWGWRKKHTYSGFGDLIEPW
jgi:hypothetical protein